MEAFKNTLQHRIYGGALYCCIMVFVFVLLGEAVPENRYAGLLLVLRRRRSSAGWPCWPRR